MTINGTNNMTMRDSMGMKVDKRIKAVWCVEESHLYSSATEFAKAKGTCLTNAYRVLNSDDDRVTCKGFHISYEENVRKTQRMLANRIAAMNNERSEFDEMKKKAALWDAYQKEQEAARKAEEDRQTKIAKATEKRDKRYQKYILAMGLYEEAERELSALLEGGNGNA